MLKITKIITNTVPIGQNDADIQELFLACLRQIKEEKLP